MFLGYVRCAVVLGAAIAAAALGAIAGPPARRDAEWPDYLGGPESAQFSGLDQINRSNVGELAVAWRYAFPGNAQSNANPLIIDGRMYAPSSAGIVALDAATGQELWRLDAPGVRMRGLSSWLSPDGRSRRLFYNRHDRLYAIDAANGAPIASFGENGSIDLKVGFGRDPKTIKAIESQTPGRVFGDLIIVGSTGGYEWNAPPGDIRAFDVRSGRLVWTFHTIPHPGEVGDAEWPKGAWKHVGGANDWSELTLDPKSGILFVPLASAKYNFYGVTRPGKNLYADSIVALDARTGKRLWHFQTVHHDLWDYDLPQAPKLLTLQRQGRTVEAVAVASKTGFVFTFERRTGRPVFRIEERPVPQTDVPGEHTSPTQPFPTAPPPFARQRFDANDLSPFMSPDERAAMKTMVRDLRNDGLFTPPSLKGSIAMPGTSGGTNWGNGAVDPRTGRLFIVSIETPGILKLEKGAGKGKGLFVSADTPPGAAVYEQNCAACHGAERKGQPPVIPALVDIAQRRSVQEVRETITRGQKTMPAFSLAAQPLDDLLAYLGYARSAAPALAPDAATAGAAAAAAAKPVAHDPITYKSGYNFVFSKLGLPANAPPWATITAYDMNVGKILWQAPFGELPRMPAVGSIFPRGTIVATGGGLLIAANQDRKLRAWDMDTGRVLFAADLPSTPGGVPAVYAVGGREFIAVPVASYDPAIAATVSSAIMPEGRNGIVVYALPPRGIEKPKQ